MDAKNRRFVSELLAEDCEKAWTHTGWERNHTQMVRMAGVHEEERRERKMEEMHQRKVEKMMKSAERSAGLLHRLTKSTMWRGGVQTLEREEEDARLLGLCEAKRKEWSTHWQCNEEIQSARQAMEE